MDTSPGSSKETGPFMCKLCPDVTEKMSLEELECHTVGIHGSLETEKAPVQGKST